jgi:hypothetical protein
MLSCLARFAATPLRHARVSPVARIEAVAAFAAVAE